jgi:putative DNA methylase
MMGKPPAEAKGGTTAGKRAAFRCILSGVPIDYNYIRAEGKAGRMGQKLMAIVVEGKRGRVYISPADDVEAVALQATPSWVPDLELPRNPRDFKPPNYGLTTFGSLFTPRQLVTLTTFSDLLMEVRETVKKDAQSAGMPEGGAGLPLGVLGETLTQKRYACI